MKGFPIVMFVATLSACASPAAEEIAHDAPGEGKADSPQWYQRGHFFDYSLGSRPSSGEVRDACFVMHESGEPVTVPIHFPSDGVYDVVVTAYQDAAGDEPAVMSWLIDGDPVASFDVQATDGDWDVFHATAEVAQGERELAIAFDNDFVVEESASDRNLVVCRYAVDAYGELEYESLPLGELRMGASSTVTTSLLETSWGASVIGTATTDVDCLLKGHNPGRAVFDCRYRFNMPWSSPVSVPREVGFVDAVAQPESFSTFWDRFHVKGRGSFVPVSWGPSTEFSGTSTLLILAGTQLQVDFLLSVPGPYRLEGHHLIIDGFAQLP